MLSLTSDKNNKNMNKVFIEMHKKDIFHKKNGISFCHFVLFFENKTIFLVYTHKKMRDFI